MQQRHPTLVRQVVSRRRRRGNRGIVMVVVLVCMALATMTLVVVARQAGAARSAAESDYRSLQAQWLAEAGLERAVARLAAKAGYDGETWQLSAKDMNGPHDAEVRIRAEKVTGRPDRRVVHVEADYPRDPALRCRRSRRVEVDLQQATRSPASPTTKQEP